MNEDPIEFANVDEKSGETKTEFVFRLGNLEVMDAFDRTDFCRLDEKGLKRNQERS